MSIPDTPRQNKLHSLRLFCFAKNQSTVPLFFLSAKSHALVETSSAYSDFLLCKKSVIRFTVSPLRKKYHSVQLLVCKRTRNAELSLTTFCGFWISLRKKSVDRSAILPLRKKSRSAQLFAYKCAHDAELSLPTFCGYRVLSLC